VLIGLPSFLWRKQQIGPFIFGVGDVDIVLLDQGRQHIVDNPKKEVAKVENTLKPRASKLG
jgi:hypothetical protein